jgi:REP element-mobilizing transposase RayT
MPAPIYTPHSCSPAYQLRWSLALFAHGDLPPVDSWYEGLQAAVERDGVRLLEHHHKAPNVWFFLLSTKPPVRPPEIIKSVKGRVQHLVRQTNPKAFRRNFSLTSIGDVRRDVVEAYVADQLGHHRMADPGAQKLLDDLQIAFPEVDLSEPQMSSHGRYVCNLHLVLVHQQRWCEVRRDRLQATRDMVLRAARAKGHRLSRLSLFVDHLHLVLGCGYEESPEDVALSYLNNLAYAHGMVELYCQSYYVGTFGEYDMGAVWRRLP